MSIKKQILTYPDTLRTFAINSDNFKQVESLFVTPDTFSFTAEQFDDPDFWYQNLGVNIFPIHSASDFTIMDSETAYKESLHNFTFKTDAGKYRHKVKFNFSLDYHQLLSELSGQKLRIIYASGLWLRATQSSTGIIQGFQTSAFELEKILFNLNSSTGNSDLFIELLDVDELNIMGYEKQMAWSPSDMDRLVLNIILLYGVDTVTMYANYMGEPVTTIESSDITWNDETNDPLTFSLFINSGGVYQMGGFSPALPTTGCLSVKSSLYIGQKRYQFTASVSVSHVRQHFESGNYEMFESANYEFFNT